MAPDERHRGPSQSPSDASGPLGGAAAASIPELVAEVTDLGLDADLAEAYLQLALRGPTPVGDLVRMLQTSRADVYRRLHRLESDGYVVRSVSRPAMYSALPPDELLRGLEGRHLRAAERVVLARERLAPVLARAHGAAPTSSAPRVQIIQTRERTNEAVARLITQATTELIGVITVPAAFANSPRFGLVSLLGRPEFSHLRKRMVFREGADPAVVAEWNHVKGIELRSIRTDRQIRFGVADGRNALVFMAQGTTQRLTADDEIALWTDAPLMVDQQLALFELLWDRGTSVKS